MDSTTARIHVSEPKLYTTTAIIIVSAFGIVGLLPILLLFLIVSLLGFKLSTLFLGLAVIVAVILLLPIISGNPYVTKLVRSLDSEAAAGSPDGVVVQLTLSPRLRTDLRALAEDADDIGFLTATESGFLFHGDSIKLCVPFTQITRVERKYRGLRSLFVPRIVVTTSVLPGITAFEFGERCSNFLPASRKVSQRLYDLLAAPLARTARK